VSTLFGGIIYLLPILNEDLHAENFLAILLTEAATKSQTGKISSSSSFAQSKSNDNIEQAGSRIVSRAAKL